MKVRFATKELEYYYVTPLEGFNRKIKFPKEIIKQFKKKVQILLSVDSVEDLKQFRSLNFEALKGEKKGSYSIRLNIQYRLILKIEKAKEEKLYRIIIVLIEISKHYE